MYVTDYVPKKYVVEISVNGEDTLSLKTASQIIRDIDMFDCLEFDHYYVFDIDNESASKLEIYGCWHDPSNPLSIKATYPNGLIAFDGYGTDH